MHRPLAPDPTAPHRRCLGDSALLGLLALAVCLLLDRGVWHGLDAYQFLSDIDHGQLFNDRHVLYKPVAWLFASALRPLGVPLYESAVAASMVCTVVGAAFVHRALLGLGLPRADAATAAVAAAGCFAVVYFSTVVEIHGVFFAFVGVAWWAFAKFAHRPTPLRALLAGAACGLSAAAHATGHLLLGTFCACTIAWCRDRLRLPGMVLAFASLGAGHFAAATIATQTTMRLTHTVEPGQKTGLFEGPIGYVGNMLGLQTDWSTAPQVFAQEWLLPFLPLSLVPLLALVLPRFRLEAALQCVCIGVYVAAAVVLLSPRETLRYPQYLPPLTLIEYGAYFLPLAVPAAATAVRLLPARARPLLAVLTVGWTAWAMLHPDRPARDDAFGRAVLTLVDEQKASVLCGGYAELDSVMRLRPGLGAPQFIQEPDRLAQALQYVPKMPERLFEPQFLTAYELLIWAFTFRSRAGAPPEGGAVDERAVQQMFDYLYEVAHKHGGLLVTADALAVLCGTKDGMFDALVLRYIPAHYDLVPFDHGAFHGFRAVKKA
jgi:hypothetical protein